jgi:dienelactone hydrolase
MRAILAALGTSLIAGVVTPCSAEVVEEVIDVPVRVRNIYRQLVDQPIKVTVFRDTDRAVAPYLILNHGRPPRPDQYAGMGRQRYSANSKYFVSRGFVVLVPTRVGYGESGGPDVEYSGVCREKNYAPVYQAAADQTLATLEFASTLPYVDAARGIVVGQSFGGTTAIAVAALGAKGLLGAVNFAGGGGGDPVARPRDPCGAALLTDLFAAYGARSRVPTLWLYSENDRYFGIEHPRRWFDAFANAGGTGTLVVLPPFKDDGHGSFSGNPPAWQPAFEAFIAKLPLSP